jgi:hypothetical protein
MNYHISTIFHLITKEARRFDPSNPADILLLLFYTLDRSFHPPRHLQREPHVRLAGSHCTVT